MSSYYTKYRVWPDLFEYCRFTSYKANPVKLTRFCGKECLGMGCTQCMPDMGNQRPNVKRRITYLNLFWDDPKTDMANYVIVTYGILN